MERARGSGRLVLCYFALVLTTLINSSLQYGKSWLVANGRKWVGLEMNRTLDVAYWSALLEV